MLEMCLLETPVLWLALSVIPDWQGTRAGAGGARKNKHSATKHVCTTCVALVGQVVQSYMKHSVVRQSTSSALLRPRRWCAWAFVSLSLYCFDFRCSLIIYYMHSSDCRLQGNCKCLNCSCTTMSKSWLRDQVWPQRVFDDQKLHPCACPEESLSRDLWSVCPAWRQTCAAQQVQAVMSKSSGSSEMAHA